MTKDQIHEAELEGVKGDTLLHRIVTSLVSHCRSLQHQLDDPNYLYSGRIHRQAILVRNATIDKLQIDKEALNAKVHELEALIDADLLARKKV